MKIDKVDRLVLKTMEPARPRAVSQLTARGRAVSIYQRVENNALQLHARTTPAGVACVFYRSALGFNFRQTCAAFYFHNLVTQQRGPLKL